MGNFALAIGQTTSRSALRVQADASSASASGLAHIDDFRTRPLGSIPASQAYYWHRKWQAAEQETLANLAAGAGKDFVDPQAVIAWLLSDDDEQVDNED